jgi:hypothetical protein
MTLVPSSWLGRLLERVPEIRQADEPCSHARIC